MLAIVVLAWLVLRRAAVRSLHLPRRPDTPGAAAGVGLTTALAAALVWVFNPYAAALLVLAAHLWLLAAAPEVPVRRPVAVAMVLAGAVPLALAVLGYGIVLHAAPLRLASILLIVAAGSSGVAALVLGSAVLGCACSALVVAARRPAAPAAVPPSGVRSRGPLSYAGPGSLGGTESALRRTVSRRA
jgi:hypothetical protein